MYRALYRKWRPAVFGDVAGQPHITTTLKNEIRAGRIAHAYIFTGSRGTGKTSCAKILAKAVNCLRPRDGDPCNECEICRGIDDGSITDVVEIDAASNNGVDSIRELREETGYTPVAAKYRVYIIDEAHMLSTGAFNALLKTLEEPPAYVIFVLATTEAHKIPATILSRCQRFDFGRIPAADIERRLLYIAQQEKFNLSDGAAALIARLSDGGLRDAVSLLDQCASVSNDISEQVVSDAAGLSGREYLFELADAVASKDAGAALKTIDRLYRASKDCERLCGELTAHFRGIMLVQTAADAAEEILGLPAGDFAQLQEEAKKLPPAAVLYALEALEETYERMRRSASRRTELEMCLVRLCVPALDSSVSSLLRRVEALENRSPEPARRSPLRAAEPARPAASEERPENAAPPQTPPAGETSSGGTLTEGESSPEAADAGRAEEPEREDRPLACWPEVLEALARLDAPLCGVLAGSSAVTRGGYVLVDSDNSMFATLIRQKSHQSSLVEAIRRTTGENCRVGIIKKQRKSEEGDPLEELAKNAADAGFPVGG